MSFDLSNYEDIPKTFLKPGHVFPGVVNEEPGIHGTLLFGYRPLNGLELGLHKTAVSKLNDVEALKASAKMLAERVVAWNATDGNSDENMPVTQDFILKLSPLLLAKLIAVIEGYRPTDELPAPQRAEQETAA